MTGPSVFSLLAAKLTNPDSLAQSVIIYNDDGTVKIKFYGPEVADRTPNMLRIIATIWSGLCFTAFSLIFRRK